MFSGATNYAESVDNVMLFIISVSVVMLVGVTAAMVYFVIKYNRKKHPKAEQIEGNMKLEIVWIVIPTILVLAMFWYGFTSFKEMRKAVDTALTVKVTAQMWKWSFEYENGIKTDTLYVPVDNTIKLELKSIDVNHSFYVPAFRQKEDVVPGRNNFMIIKPKLVGDYDIACAEYCGMQHSYMYSKVVVMPQNDFYSWYNTESQKTIIQSSDTTGNKSDTIKTVN